MRGLRGGERASHGPHASVERQLADAERLAEGVRAPRAARRLQQPERDRQIERRPFLPRGGRREVA